MPLKSFSQRVVVRVPNWIGDVIHSLPALEAVQRHFPQAELTVVARGQVGALIYGYSVVVNEIEGKGADRRLGGISRS